MSNWELGSKPYTDGSRDVLINFLTDDTTGAVKGMLRFKNMVFDVHGQWSAAGSTPGRNFSAVALWAADSNANDYVAAAGVVQFDNGSAVPTSMDFNLIRVETGNGQQYGWDGQLLPVTHN